MWVSWGIGHLYMSININWLANDDDEEPAEENSSADDAYEDTRPD